ncbi:hypothetical protein [Rhodococcus opacus]|uniref:hypothetical protein n=1 Tax=Rhodococcus opacus TaxID=37919 RepID=UPI0013D9BE8F|nr:hypothetical protein [Rhodococcus opacus]
MLATEMVPATSTVVAAWTISQVGRSANHELATLDDATALGEAHEVWQLLSLAEYRPLVG